MIFNLEIGIAINYTEQIFAIATYNTHFLFEKMFYANQWYSVNTVYGDIVYEWFDNSVERQSIGSILEHIEYWIWEQNIPFENLYIRWQY